MTQLMPQSNTGRPRRSGVPTSSPRRRPPPDGAPLTAEEADLAQRLANHFAQHPKPDGCQRYQRVDDLRREAGPEDIAVVREVEPAPFAALDIAPLPAYDDPVAAARPEIKSVKWLIASRRARFKAFARSLTAWVTTGVIILTVFAGATVVLLGSERSTAIVNAASAHATALVSIIAGFLGVG